MEEMIRILLVDDEDSFRGTVSKRLSRRSMDVRTASDGREALDQLEHHSVEVVVTDVKMPGMNGIELLRHIKEKYSDIEVILLTGHVAASDGVEGIKGGAFDYLTKPVELEHLVSKIRQAREKIRWRQDQRKEAEFRKRMEQQMMITERLAALGTMATGVAHEINNPLAIIRESAGWMRLILGKEEMAAVPRRADLERALNKIETGVERAKRITHQLLGFVQKDDNLSAEVDLPMLIEESLGMVEREAVHKGIEIVRDIQSLEKPVYSDPYQIRQVLLNLITNAVHATGGGGRITVVLKSIQGGVLIQIRDTGEGIPPEQMRKIFEPFFTTKCPGKGTGLGLFVTRGIIDRLGGTIEAESRPDEGSVFTVTIPLRHEIRKNDIASELNTC